MDMRLDILLDTLVLDLLLMLSQLNNLLNQPLNLLVLLEPLLYNLKLVLLVPDIGQPPTLPLCLSYLSF